MASRPENSDQRQAQAPPPKLREALHVGRARRSSSTVRAWLAEKLADHLDPAMSALGIIFLLLVIAEGSVDDPKLGGLFVVVGWIIWAIFVAEFILRAVIAPSLATFLRRHWWQLLFLVLPFLRFLRLLRLLRISRAGRLVSSAVRSTRSAARTLGSRLAWLGAVHVIVVLTATQLLFEFGSPEDYGVALHAVALASVSGQPFSGVEGTVARVLEVALATYAIVVFGTIAATIGAFFLERRPGADPGAVA